MWLLIAVKSLLHFVHGLHLRSESRSTVFFMSQELWQARAASDLPQQVPTVHLGVLSQKLSLVAEDAPENLEIHWRATVHATTEKPANLYSIERCTNTCHSFGSTTAPWLVAPTRNSLQCLHLGCASLAGKPRSSSHHSHHNWDLQARKIIDQENMYCITYLPHEAVAEVSKDKEPRGRRSGIDLVRKSNWFQVQLFCISFGLKFNGFEIQLYWFEIQLLWAFKFHWLSIDVSCFESQVIWDSIVLWFDCFESQLIWDSSALRSKWFPAQRLWGSSDVRFEWFGCQLVWESIGCHLMWDLIDLVVNWFEIKKFKIQSEWAAVDLRFKWF